MGKTWDRGTRGYWGCGRDIGDTRGHWEDMGKHGTWGAMGWGYWGYGGQGDVWAAGAQTGGARGGVGCDPCSCHQGVSLSLRPGEVVAVLAPPGGGKSSLVAAALGLHPLAGGAVLLDGNLLTPRSGPALRQQVTHTGHPRAATAIPGPPSLPCCCPPVTKPLQCIPMATLLSPTGPHSHPCVCIWQSEGPHCCPQVTPVPQMGSYCHPKITSGCPQCHPVGPQFHFCVTWVPSSTPVSQVGYLGYPQATHPNSHDHRLTLCSQHIPTATPK